MVGGVLVTHGPFHIARQEIGWLVLWWVDVIENAS
jgi:hypothetical protein